MHPPIVEYIQQNVINYLYFPYEKGVGVISFILPFSIIWVHAWIYIYIYEM